VRRTITTAVRVLLGSALVISSFELATVLRMTAPIPRSVKGMRVGKVASRPYWAKASAPKCRMMRLVLTRPNTPERTTAVAKVVVMGVSGVFGLVNTSLIIRHFGARVVGRVG